MEFIIIALAIVFMLLIFGPLSLLPMIVESKDADEAGVVPAPADTRK